VVTFHRSLVDGKQRATQICPFASCSKRHEDRPTSPRRSGTEWAPIPKGAGGAPNPRHLSPLLLSSWQPAQTASHSSLDFPTPECFTGRALTAPGLPGGEGGTQFAWGKVVSRGHQPTRAAGVVAHLPERADEVRHERNQGTDRSSQPPALLDP